MDKAGLFTLTSGLHSEVIPDVSEESFIREIVAAGTAFDYCGDDFSSYGSRDTELIYVRTGGTENAFKAVFPRLTGPVRLLTSGASNSLARPSSKPFISAKGLIAVKVQVYDHVQAFPVIEIYRHIFGASASILKHIFGADAQSGDGRRHLVHRADAFQEITVLLVSPQLDHVAFDGKVTSYATVDYGAVQHRIIVSYYKAVGSIPQGHCGIPVIPGLGRYVFTTATGIGKIRELNGYGTLLVAAAEQHNRQKKCKYQPFHIQKPVFVNIGIFFRNSVQ